MKLFAAYWIVFGALLCAGCVSGSHSRRTLERRYPVKPASVAVSRKGDLKMYQNGKKTARIATTEKVHSAGDSVHTPRTHAAAAAKKLDPASAGTRELSMQDYNRYAYRKTHSSEPGVPVTRAGGEEDADDMHKNVKE